MDLPEKFIHIVDSGRLFTTRDKLLVTVSGGVDSVVLCELCKRTGYNFAIAHCNFQLRGDESDRDENFVASLAARYNVDFHTTRFDTKSIAADRGLSTQEAARSLRYEWFEEIRVSNGYNYILTAHHADDNIETVLMKFFRGTGIKGLRGIEPKHGHLVRPLLFARRKELEEFLTTNNLEYVVDRSNLEDDYTRNYFRHQVIPLVEKSFPNVQDNLLANIGRFTDVEMLYEQALAIQKKKLLEQKGNEVHIPVLKLAKRQPLRTIVYDIISGYGFNAAQTGDVLSLLESESGKYVQSASHRIIRHRKWLIIAPLQEQAAATVVISEDEKNARCATLQFQLTTEIYEGKKPPASNSTAWLDAQLVKFPLLLRKWKQGDYFYPLGMQKKKKLSRFFIDQKLSRTEKENTWVLEMDKKIIWVVGHRIDDRFKVTGNTKKVLVIKSSP